MGKSLFFNEPILIEVKQSLPLSLKFFVTQVEGVELSGIGRLISLAEIAPGRRQALGLLE